MNEFVLAHIKDILKLLNQYKIKIGTRVKNPIGVQEIVLEKIEKLRSGFSDLMEEYDFNDNDQFKVVYNIYKTYLMQLQSLECFGLPILMYYRDRIDGKLSRIMERLGRDVKRVSREIALDKHDVPHVCGLSTGSYEYLPDYYWYHPQYHTIFVPISEVFCTLNLPDLLHELSHHICIVNSDYLSPIADSLYDKYKNGPLGKLPGTDRRIMERQFKTCWKNWWIELVCDCIATYCIGRAYAWTNLKLCLTYPGTQNDKIYQIQDSHPPDNFRMTVILKMIETMGADTVDIEKKWEKLENLSTAPKTPYCQCYHLDNAVTGPFCQDAFSVDFAGDMVETVRVFCEDMELIPFTRNIREKKTLIYKINRDWDRFLN